MAEEDKRFSKQLIGKTVVSKTGKRFGEVGDLIFETRSGELIHLVFIVPVVGGHRAIEPVVGMLGIQRDALLQPATDLDARPLQEVRLRQRPGCVLLAGARRALAPTRRTRATTAGALESVGSLVRHIRPTAVRHGEDGAICFARRIALSHTGLGRGDRTARDGDADQTKKPS